MLEDLVPTVAVAASRPALRLGDRLQCKVDPGRSPYHTFTVTLITDVGVTGSMCCGRAMTIPLTVVYRKIVTGCITIQSRDGL